MSADGTVIGCVWGAYRALTANLDRQGKQPPTYEWCERQWREGLSRTAPSGGALPGWLEQELFWRWRNEGRQLTLWEVA